MRRWQTARGAFQRVQLPLLGIDVRLVTGYDQQELLPWHRECLFSRSHPANNATAPLRAMYVSQLLKMFAAFWDMERDALRTALFMEDDAVAHFGRLPALNAALTAALHGNSPAVLHVSTYSPIGHDLQAHCGLRPASHGKLWSGVANVVNAATARRLLHHGTIVARASDLALSLSRDPSIHGGREFSLKPFPFTAGAYGSNVFACNMEVACERAWYGSFSKRFVHPTWSSQARVDAINGTRLATKIRPATHGCPEQLACSNDSAPESGRGIHGSKYGATCLKLMGCAPPYLGST